MPRVIRSTPRPAAGTVILLLSLLAAGCAPSSFDQSFERAARAPAALAQPIVGAWQGSWTSEDGDAGGAARLVVTAAVAPDPADRLGLELGGFPQPYVTEQFAAEATFDPRLGPVRDFAAKVPAVVTEQGLCAAALGMQARVDGDQMRIDFWVNDALQQVSAGRIQLRRAGTPAVATTQP